jgi:hypothetical protein
MNLIKKISKKKEGIISFITNSFILNSENPVYSIKLIVIIIVSVENLKQKNKLF